MAIVYIFVVQVLANSSQPSLRSDLLSMPSINSSMYILFLDCLRSLSRLSGRVLRAPLCVTLSSPKLVVSGRASRHTWPNTES